MSNLKARTEKLVIFFQMITCCWSIRLNVTVGVETTIDQNQLLTNPASSRVLMKNSSRVRINMSRGWHARPLPRDLQPNIILQKKGGSLIFFTLVISHLRSPLISCHQKHFFPFVEFILWVWGQPYWWCSWWLILWSWDLETVSWSVRGVWWRCLLQLFDRASWQQHCSTGSSVLSGENLISTN